MPSLEIQFVTMEQKLAHVEADFLALRLKENDFTEATRQVTAQLQATQDGIRAALASIREVDLGPAVVTLESLLPENQQGVGHE